MVRLVDERIICPNCNGRGHVLDGVVTLLATALLGLGIALAFLEKNNPEGITREKCSPCRGRGWLDPPSSH